MSITTTRYSERFPHALASELADLLQHQDHPAPLEPAVSVVQHDPGHHGGWAVHLTLDGYYSTAEGAESVLPHWQESLNRVLAAPAEVDYDSRCPACDRPSLYLSAPDRHYHEDGSDNERCWLAILRGEVDQ